MRSKNNDLILCKKYYKIYEKEIKPFIIPLYNDKIGMHSIEHINNVVKYALYILIVEYPKDQSNLYKAVSIAAALHDCARTNDNWCTMHEILAIPKIEAFFELYGDYFNLTDEMKCNIIRAVSTHTSMINCNSENDIISCCLHDADRIRLAKEYGYNEKYFSTRWGKFLATNHINI